MTKLYLELRDYKTNETMLLTEDQFMDYAAKLLKDNGRDEKPQQLQHARYLIEEYYATHEVTPMEEAVEIQKIVKKLIPNLMP